MDKWLKKSFLLSLFCLILHSGCQSSTIVLIADQKSAYEIMIPAEASKTEVFAAKELQRLLKLVSGLNLSISAEKPLADQRKAIYIGKVKAFAQLPDYAALKDDGFLIYLDEAQNLFLGGRWGKSTLYSVYHFAEQYLNVQKYDSGSEQFQAQNKIEIEDHLKFLSNPDFVYRQSYYPMSNDALYLNWHKLQKFEDLWGLWGHSFFKLLPPAQYFKAKPEYYALVNGKRQATQLCMSNVAARKLVIEELKRRMADNPDALYWSISPEDNTAYCTCTDCSALIQKYNKPSGAYLYFLNAIAAEFPEHKFTALAYTYTSDMPKNIKPADNVVMFLSNIEAYRESPLEHAASAQTFVKQLMDWASISKQIFIWDYTTQYTHYLAPFPYIAALQPNLQFFKKHQVTGVFEHGSEDTYADMAELYSYMQAKLLWNTEYDLNRLLDDFCTGYYAQGGPAMKKYLKLREQNLIDSKKHLDIYGDPIAARTSFLSVEQLQSYDNLITEALAAEKREPYQSRIKRAAWAITYTRLQQARFYGADEHGFLELKNESLQLKPDFEAQVKRFVDELNRNDVKLMAEAGISPNAYLEEWQVLLKQKWNYNLASKAKITLAQPYSEDFAAKGPRTLNDQMIGFNDFSYNWLCFYGNDMAATLDFPEAQPFSKVSINFLDDPKHWIFLPEQVLLEGSDDGKNFKLLAEQKLGNTQEHESVHIKNVSFAIKATFKYLRITAKNPKVLPPWRNYSKKKPMIASDEISVLP